MTRSAAILGALLGALFSVSSARAEVTVSDAARELFREGVAHLKADVPRYDEAYEAFKAAYADSPSPKILGNLGLSATKLERDGEAIEAYRRYLAEAGAKSTLEKRQIAADLEALEKRVSRLTLEVAPASAAVLDRRTDGQVEVVNRYTIDEGVVELGLRAGTHHITITADGFGSEELTLELEPGDAVTQKVALRAVAPEPAISPSSPAPRRATDADADEAAPIGMWVAVGATGALAIATGVVGGLAASNHGEFEEAQQSGDAARAAELRDDGATLNVAGDVLLGVTLAGAATAVILVVLELTDEDGEGGEARLTPVVTPEGGYLGVAVRF